MSNTKTNQLIQFQGKEIKLPSGFKWSIYRQITTTGLQPMRGHGFEDFDYALHKWQDGAFHLFELRQGDHVRLMAYCSIKHIANSN